MPLYVYECEGCKHADEYLMKMSESDITLACDKCGGDMHRVLGAIENQLVKWKRRYKDENGREQILDDSPPGGSYRNTVFTKGRKHGKGKKFVYDAKTGKMIEK